MGPKPRPVAERLFSKVAAGPNGCIVWTGGRTTNGYGKFQIGKHTGLAHRAAYELMVGKIPDGLHIDHLCRNRACINHHHLEPVTCRENLLRGNTFQAANAAKTHCPSGHPYAGLNLYIEPRGVRSCRTCKNEGKRRRRRNGRLTDGCR